MSARLSATADLSLSELLHVLDVARTLRRDQELAESELNRDQWIASLKARLLAAARETGDQVTAEEVDAAIRIYFEDLHTYADPPLSLPVFLAHVYVRRAYVGAGLASCAILVLLAWWLFWSAEAPLSSRTRAERRQRETAAALDRTIEAVEQRLHAARAVAEDPKAIEQVERLNREAGAARETGDIGALSRLGQEALELEARLRESYEVQIVSAPGRYSGIERDFDGELSGAYLIVEARDAAGRVLPRTIVNRETGAAATVQEWGEQVPPEVLQRIEADKRADGVVDERVFAIKRRGRLEEEVQLPGADGRPLVRQRQITAW